MAEEKNMNPESFDQDSVMIYIDPKVLNSLNDMAEKKQEDLKALQAAAEDGDLDAQYRLGGGRGLSPRRHRAGAVL